MEQNNIISSGLLELYVLGMASDQEIAQVTAMAKQYPEVEAEIASIESSLEEYARLDAVLPSPEIKQKILAAVSNNSHPQARDQQQQAKVIPVSSFWKYAAAASVILLIGSAILNYNYYNKFHSVNRELVEANNQKATAEKQLAVLSEQNTEVTNKWKLFQSKYSEPVSLHGLPASPDAAAKIIWMKNTGEVYIDPTNLPDAPEGKQYQFWGIVDGKPVDGGMIISTKNDDKYRIQKMKSFGKAEAFAVTLETTGGNPTPLGEMFVMGKM